jgi:16S rRNA (cytidine1402-2'-O)-methyltransferase
LGELCQKAGVEVIPIPGVSAVATILSVAGVPANEFRFAGYVPTKKGRQTFIKKLIESEDAVVFFETAPRLTKFLGQLVEFGGNNKKIIIGRELTKQFEEIKSGVPQELLDFYTEIPPKGELVLVIR